MPEFASEPARPTGPFRPSPGPRDRRPMPEQRRSGRPDLAFQPVDSIGECGLPEGPSAADLRETADGLGTAGWPAASDWLESDTGPGLSDTESVLRRVNCPRSLRPGLRVSFLIELRRIERRRRNCRQAAGVLTVLLVSGFLMTALHGGTSAAMSLSRTSADSLAHSPEYIVEASREPDSWALVDAYSRHRDSRSAALQPALARLSAAHGDRAESAVQ